MPVSNVNQITGEIQQQNKAFKAGKGAKNVTVILKVPLMGLNATLKQVNVLVNQVYLDTDVTNACPNTLDLEEWDASHVTVTLSDRFMASVIINQVNANVNQVSLVTNVTNATPITLVSVKKDAVHVTATWTDQSSPNAIMRVIVSAALVSKAKSATNAKKTISISVPVARNATTVTIW